VVVRKSPTALEERCDGLAETFKGEVVSQFVGLDATRPQQNQIARPRVDPAIDGFMGTGPVIAMSGLNAATDAGKALKGIAGFDITPEIIDAIKAGSIAFTIDQQHPAGLPADPAPVLVRHEPERRRRPAILTGPGFVDRRMPIRLRSWSRPAPADIQ
jgi:simple sugar transport system substrate-binding protein